MAYAPGYAPIVRPRKRRMSKAIRLEDGPFLIWSHYHGCWHRRSSEGKACGYTTDLKSAGVFDHQTAKAYHDLGNFPVRDEAIPLSRAKHQLIRHRAEAQRHLHNCERMLALIRSPGGLAP